jgi:REP element-mobilizing transposase RayT
MDYWLATTDHLTDRIWFRDDEDFTMGMNLVAILAIAIHVNVLSFILMSNHVHFVLCCPYGKAMQFMNEYKRRYSQYLSGKYGGKEQLRKVHVDIRAISGNDESLEWAIAYVHMNPVAAGICLSATGYPWGTGNTFFKAKREKGRLLGTLSERARRRLLHSKVELPLDFLVVEDGYILPESYVNRDFVESVFRTPARMNYFLNNSSKAKRRLESGEKGSPAFRDQIILSAIPDLCGSLFHKASVNELTKDEQTELLKQLRFRFSANVNQLARVTGLSYATVTELLNRL